MAWTDITNAQVAAGAAITTALMTALRDNVPAAANRDTGAPKLQTDFQFLERIELSGEATADFTAFDATKYDSYVFVFGSVIPTSDSAVLLAQVSFDGGSSWDAGAGNYTYGFKSLNFSSATVSGARSSASTSMSLTGGVGSGVNEVGVSGTFEAFSPHKVALTMFRYSLTYLDSATRGATVDGGGVHLEVEAVDGVRFLFTSGNMESGNITMYGRRND